MPDNLILNIPHASTSLSGLYFSDGIYLAAAAGAVRQMLHDELLPMTDWYTDELFINGIGTPIVAPVSRIVCDTERFRNDEDEPMSIIGMGVCYTRTHDLKYGIPRNQGHRERTLCSIYDVHHRKLQEAVDSALMNHKTALILDCHSFSPVPLPYEPDRDPDRPDICIGTDPFHTPPELTQQAVEFFRSKGYSVKTDSPYSGTIVPVKHLHRTGEVHSIMVELNRGLYLKSGTSQKSDYFPILKQHLALFEQLLIDFSACFVHNSKQESQ